MASPADILRGIPFFADIPEPVLEKLASRCVPRTVGDGFTLFRSGDRCSGLYLVLDGQVRIYRTATDGREQTLSLEGPGRPVAELPLFDGGPYPASAVTVKPSRLAFLPRAEFEHAFQTDPDVATAVVRALGGRLRHLVQLVETLAFRDVAARLAMLLADQADQRGTVTGDSVHLELDQTQEQLATAIGTARESVSRAMKQLKTKGLIRSQEGNLLELVPAARLRDYARGDE
ncbi:MAG: Crp/Fnr family transcriptional regulator [Gemmatimonadetes bacterium]|nr:Crp/Fnr family transcriptional regulator [Gemmatimonadota bacterium]MBL0178610.1 Crp/Fnr family transcriptional regulator [Gemmatimonadota bacterium]